MTLNACAGCHQTRQTSDGLCVDCLAARLHETAVELAVLREVRASPGAVVFEAGPGARLVQLEGGLQYVQAGDLAARAVASIFRATVRADHGDLQLGECLLPDDGLPLLAASFHYARQVAWAPDGGLLPAAIRHHVTFAVHDAPEAHALFEQAHVLPASVRAVLDALHLQPPAAEFHWERGADTEETGEA